MEDGEKKKKERVQGGKSTNKLRSVKRRCCIGVE